MTVIYFKEYNCGIYAVDFEYKGCVKIQNSEDISDDENILLYIKPLKTFSGKSEVCDKKTMSGAFDKSVYDANTILLKISEENDNHRWLYIGSDKVCFFNR